MSDTLRLILEIGGPGPRVLMILTETVTYGGHNPGNRHRPGCRERAI
jgi:hypothetical protein